MLRVENGKTFGWSSSAVERWVGGVYIGRANPAHGLTGSPLANPFVVGKDGERRVVVEKYRRWLWEQVKEWRATGKQTPVTTALNDLVEQVKAGKDITLICWCAPLPCHGDVIVSAVNWLIQEGR